MNLYKLISINNLKDLDNNNYNYEFYNNNLTELEKLNIKSLDEKQIYEIINNSDLTNIYLDLMSDYKKDILFKSEIHGIKHNIRVSLYALIISVCENISIEDFKIVIEGAKYHDVGRVLDNEDRKHGYNSTLKLDFLNSKYTKEEINKLKTIIEAHSLPDDEFECVAQKYNVKELEKCKKMYKILKDADGLDRVRLEYPLIKINLLRTETAKRLIKYSYKINYNFEDIMKEDVYE